MPDIVSKPATAQGQYVLQTTNDQFLAQIPLVSIMIIANHLLSSKIISGGDRIFIELGKRWQCKGLDVQVMLPRTGQELCVKEGLSATYYLLPDSKIDRMYSFSFLIPLIFLRRTIMACFENRNAKCLKNTGNSVIFSSGDFICDVFPAWWIKARKPETLWIANIHHIVSHPLGRRLSVLTDFFSFIAQRMSFWFIKRNSDLIFVLNNVVKHDLIGKGFPEGKLFVIGAGIDFSMLEKIPPSKKKYDACFLGRIHPSKGIFDLIKIWYLVTRKKADARLVIVGVGSESYLKELMEAIQRDHLDSAINLILCMGKDAMSVMKSSDIFISASHEEGWGIAICEAMACGLPVIAYDLPAYREIFSNDILKVPKYDIHKFSEKIVYLLQNETQRITLGNKGRSQAKKYDWNDVALKELVLIQNEFEKSNRHRCDAY